MGPCEIAVLGFTVFLANPYRPTTVMARLCPRLWPEPQGQGHDRLRGQVLPDDVAQSGLDLIGLPVPDFHDQGKVRVFDVGSEVFETFREFR